MTPGLDTSWSPDGISREIKKSLSPYFRSARYFRSETLWHEGDTTGMLVTLLEGRVKIYRLTPDGRAITLYVMRPGNVFGFLPLIDGGPYPVSAEALEDVNALVITRAQFLDALHADPRVAVPLLEFLSGHLRSAFELIMRLSSRDALSRVASALSGLYDEMGRSAGENIIKLPISSKEYASLLGLTPESFSRKITELVELGILGRSGVNRFIVLDSEKLTEQAVPKIIL
jgi:CRP-like cAMP-binding protein